MAHQRVTENVAGIGRERNVDMDRLVCGMERSIGNRPDRMMDELEELCQPKKKQATQRNAAPKVAHNSYLRLLKANESFDSDDLSSRLAKDATGDDGWSVMVNTGEPDPTRARL